jgi:bifunctional UDP-N-acetylglucosamine pyrophosphorylase/glucosamine-1-phosphate N-acetyltransferase
VTRLTAAIILAAGAGTRMRSDLPKVMHVVAGRTLLGHVLTATADVGTRRAVVVVGHGREQVVASLGEWDVTPVVQDRLAGTGHAVRVALGELEDLEPGDQVMVLPGDAPLLTASTLEELVCTHQVTGAVATVLTAVVDDATGYGRVVRDDAGRVVEIVEHRDADAATAAIREINAGVYVFAVGPLREALSKVTTDNAQGEEYLTDVVGTFVATGSVVAAHTAEDFTEVSGVNDRVQLAAAGRILRDRIVTEAMLAGTTVVDPSTTWVDAGVTLEPDTTLWPNTHLRGRTHIGRGAVIGPDCTLTDTVVGEGAVVTRAVAEGSEIGARATVGPFTHLRPGTRLGVGGKLGAFVETKAADLGEGTKVPHLSYVGDAVVGARDEHRLHHRVRQLRRCGQAPFSDRLGCADRQRHDDHSTCDDR